MKKAIISIVVLGMVLYMGITVYGKGKAFDAADFNMGYQLMDMLDKDAYQQDGKKMAQIISDLFENMDSTDNMCKVEKKTELLGDVYYKKTVSGAITNYTYYGELKDEKPNGWGILLDMSGNPFYVGNFKKGKIQGYGIVLNYSSDYHVISVVYEGKISKVKADGDVVPANGSVIIPYDLYSIANAYCDEINSSDEEITLEEGAWVLKCMPKYIGKVKGGEYSGKGTLYDIYGNVIYEGEFKKGKYSGKGTLYYEDGSIQYTGKFKNGKFNGKGTLYERDGSVLHKGEFKNGDVK